MTPVSEEACNGFANFLTQVLGSDKFEVFQLAGDASARKYYRVVLGEDSWVLMVWEPFVDDGNYPFLSVRDHFSKHGVGVPKVIGKSPGEGLILLEDLGDLTLERKFWENQNQQLVVPFYRQTIDELIKIHYSASFDRTDCTAFKIEFDVEKLLWELNYGREHLLVRFCGVHFTETEKKALDKVFLDICTILHAEPKYIAHRDYHSRNVMLKLGKARVIDFQDARLGPVQYDLVSLLRDSYVNIEPSIADSLIKYYLERRNEVRSKYPLEDISIEKFMRIYEIQTIQRCFKACGSFASFYNLRSDIRYLKYIAHTLQTVKRSLLDFKEYRAFHDILDDKGVFERKFEAS